ncbi:MAG TPA: hypothetical protein VF887_03135, partial [Gemmatimonadaceae bacterium]
RRVATTSTGGRDTAGFDGSSCPAAGVGTDKTEASDIMLIRDDRRLSMVLGFFEVRPRGRPLGNVVRRTSYQSARSHDKWRRMFGRRYTA